MLGEGYAVSGDSFDPSESSLSSADKDKEQQQLNDYIESMPSRPTDYMSNEDTSIDLRNGFENLCQDWSKNKDRNAYSTSASNKYSIGYPQVKDNYYSKNTLGYKVNQ